MVTANSLLTQLANQPYSLAYWLWKSEKGRSQSCVHWPIEYLNNIDSSSCARTLSFDLGQCPTSTTSHLSASKALHPPSLQAIAVSSTHISQLLVRVASSKLKLIPQMVSTSSTKLCWMAVLRQALKTLDAIARRGEWCSYISWDLVLRTISMVVSIGMLKVRWKGEKVDSASTSLAWVHNLAAWTGRELSVFYYYICFTLSDANIHSPENSWLMPALMTLQAVKDLSHQQSSLSSVLVIEPS